VPHGVSIEALAEAWPVFVCYVLSFIYVGIYWNNHHHLLHTATRVTGGIMWANLHLLFWLSLLPAVTAWAGEYPAAAWPAALYGVVLLAAAFAWLILQRSLIRAGSPLGKIIGSDVKGRISPVLYTAGIAVAFVRPWVSELLYAIVAAMWVVPDRRVERALTPGA
jgi:uncharacterized membrane protein